MGCEMPPERAPLWAGWHGPAPGPWGPSVGSTGAGAGVRKAAPRCSFWAPAPRVLLKVGNCVMLGKQGRPSSWFLASPGSRLLAYRCRHFPLRRVQG